MDDILVVRPRKLVEKHVQLRINRRRSCSICFEGLFLEVSGVD